MRKLSRDSRYITQRVFRRTTSSDIRNHPLIKISNGTFYQLHPQTKPSGCITSAPRPLFENLSISIPSFTTPNQHWAILSPSSTVRTSFLKILHGQMICQPPTARTYPYLTTRASATHTQNIRSPERSITYVGFDNDKKSFGGAYLSARYESRVEETDFTLQQYLTGDTQLNPSADCMQPNTLAEEVSIAVATDLDLMKLLKKPVNMLSNGQSRRARIGKALLTKPELLLLDAPFIGLDPFVTEQISSLLERLSNTLQPRIFIALRPQDVIPAWITHIIYANRNSKVMCLGPREDVMDVLRQEYEAVEAMDSYSSLSADKLETLEVGRHLVRKGDFIRNNARVQRSISVDGYHHTDPVDHATSEVLVEMKGVNVKYGDNSVLGDWSQIVDSREQKGLWWNVRRGERWGIFGANGSGKTTLLSLITSDHPQTYSAPVKLFGRARLPSPGRPGISIFDIQSRIGHASPEVHALFPRHLTIRGTLESAFGDTPLTKPRLDPFAVARVNACLAWFSEELNPGYKPRASHDLHWSVAANFADLSFSSQRVLLFLRALVRQPDIIILDEAFSGMDDTVRTKCLLFLSWGETKTLHDDAYMADKPVVNGINANQALLCVSHSMDDVPGCVRQWICLPESGTGSPRIGKLNGPVGLDARRWDNIWNYGGSVM
ncbi:ABC transporter-like protein [Pseudovirgaria hyperparasitica]|uniref:ABC transporter-like protein n=1 Tax=Pseudovirgaria hyperparasitica TaxID=470096 RepID=A0A6A6VQY0_9PEZI|nr:ABC transporter-like protein [Pseudovirgaria hyperparasitica]KAF2753068.1 ABC transporter-like protein [Pseudovirgaria hyperparasitica]